MHTINKVREFHKAFNHPVADNLNPTTKEMRELRVKLIAEEFAELCEALGVVVNIRVSTIDGTVIDVTAIAEDGEVDLVEAADALGDIDYVVQGTNLVMGIPAQLVMNEIHQSNMSKLGADGKPIYREDGKILKGPNYHAPDIYKVLQDFDPSKAYEDETVNAKWGAAGEIVAGIDEVHVSHYKQAILVQFDSKEDCKDALTGKKTIKIVDAAF